MNVSTSGTSNIRVTFYWIIWGLHLKVNLLGLSKCIKVKSRASAYITVERSSFDDVTLLWHSYGIKHNPAGSTSVPQSNLLQKDLNKCWISVLPRGGDRRQGKPITLGLAALFPVQRLSVFQPRAASIKRYALGWFLKTLSNGHSTFLHANESRQTVKYRISFHVNAE